MAPKQRRWPLQHTGVGEETPPPERAGHPTDSSWKSQVQHVGQQFKAGKVPREEHRRWEPEGGGGPDAPRLMSMSPMPPL